jgi:hypothetical protein
VRFEWLEIAGSFRRYSVAINAKAAHKSVAAQL